MMEGVIKLQTVPDFFQEKTEEALRSQVEWVGQEADLITRSSPGSWACTRPISRLGLTAGQRCPWRANEPSGASDGWPSTYSRS